MDETDEINSTFRLIGVTPVGTAVPAGERRIGEYHLCVITVCDHSYVSHLICACDAACVL